MKTAALFFLLCVSLVAAVDLSKPVPRLRLADGRILQDVQFVTFKALDVFIRHKGGSMALRYEALPDEIRAEAEQKRPGGPKWFPGETADNALMLEGQVFVQTRGAGPYKFGNVQVYAFEARHITAWQETNGREVRLPRPLSVATTDADGKFKLRVPRDTPYFIYCRTYRMIGSGGERNEWRVPGEQFKSGRDAILSNDNVGVPTKTVVIEETP